MGLRYSVGTIGRRGLLLGGGGLVAAGTARIDGARADAGLPVPPGNALAFRLIRHSSNIGTHHLTFTPQGDGLNVQIAVDVLVTLLSIPVARYTLRATEAWQGTTLMSLSGRTDKNGSQQWMNAVRTDEGLVVTGSQTKRYVAPPGAMGISYWNKHMLDGPMISVEDGVLARPKVTPLGSESVLLADGARIPASCYNVKESFDVDVGYDASNTWASLSMTVVDGSEVRYERL